MIYTDANGYPVDQTLDGGDSAMRIGMGSIAQLFHEHICTDYETSPGWFVRHPTQAPTNTNPLNFTRDQLVPLCAGLSLTEEGRAAVRRGFWKSLLRCGFAQDFQRDKPGSWKWPWPQSYYNNSYPTPTTYLWPKRAPVISGAVVDSSWFDFADPLGPAVLWHMILAGRMWYLYWLGLLGVSMLILSIWGYRWSRETENNQIIAQCFVQGKWALWLFKQVNPNWEDDLTQYWSSRNEIEYAQGLIKQLG